MITASPPLDRALRSAIHRTTARGPWLPNRTLAPLRAAAVEEIVPAYRARADACADSAELAALATDALAAMRAAVQRRARRAGPFARAAAAADALWSDCTADELLDDPALDPAVRTRIMATLDWWNGIIDCYGVFLDAIAPLARPDGPTRVLDLAAGHAGFALAAARSARRRGLDLRFTASDIKREYLDMGAAAAARDGIQLDTVVQDALDLSNLTAGDYDLITCTQSLHHFPPGLVAVMFQQAVQRAGRGVVFIDGCRSAASGLGAAAFGALYGRDLPFVHDAWISTRKCFVPEELELLARLGSWGDAVEARWLPPGYCLLRTR